MENERSGLKSGMAEFWQAKSLEQLTEAQWESLCDGCGKCCLHKLLDADAELIEGKTVADADESLFMHAEESMYYTDIRCRHLDPQTARCGCYQTRLEKVPDCVNITLADLPRIHFMPPSCAYRRLHEGRDLPSWHPLRHNGSRAAMIKAGIAVATYSTISDYTISEDHYDLRIVTWPLLDAD